ncbi:unnamed protein product, partial [Acidithrix sp. C25]
VIEGDVSAAAADDDAMGPTKIVPKVKKVARKTIEVSSRPKAFVLSLELFE